MITFKSNPSLLFFLWAAMSFPAFAQTWEWVNPLPQGNTLHAVKFIDAGTAVAVGDAATVMRTTDGGETWDISYRVTEISRSLRESLRGLSFHGQKGIAVGDSGTVITTDDGGLTWTRRESGADENLLSVFMLDDSLAVAVGWYGVIARTTDGGVTWQLQQIEIGFSEDLSAVTFVDSFGVAVGTRGSILLSNDAGLSWLRLVYPGSPWFIDVCFLNADYGFILEFGGILRTTDGGKSWVWHSIDTEGSLYDIDFYDDKRGMIAGTYGLFMTADSGKTWSQPPGGVRDDNFNSLRALDLAEDESGIAVGNPGAILTKSQGTEEWIQRSRGLPLSFYDLAFVNADTGIAVHSNLVYTYDGGKTWLADTTFCCLNTIDFADENHGTVAGSFRLIYRTDDGGRTWRKQETPLQYNLTFHDVFHVTVDTVYAVGEFGTILASTDGGKTWAEQDSGLEPDGPALNAVFFTDSRHGITVSQRAEILRTTDGGQTWSMVQSADEPLTDVYFINSDIGVVVGRHDLILRTTDGGASWIEVNRGQNALSSVDFYDEIVGFAVGRQGTILRTDDGGLSWSPEPTNTAEWLHKVFVRDANNIFAIGTRGTILKRAERVVSVREVPDETEMKPSFILLQNYPNPFNASTTVPFDLPAAGTVTIKIFDVTGRQVATVYSGHLPEGRHAIDWHSDGFASGVYFFRLEFQALNTPGKMTATRKTLLLK